MKIEPVLQIKQHDYELCVFTIPASILSEICYYNPRVSDSEAGIQRDFKKSKSSEIAEYIDSDNSVLANNIIINLELNKIGLTIEDVLKNNTLDLNKIKLNAKKNNRQNEIAFVIDGQHRLRAFDFAINKDFPLIVSAFFDLSLAEIAEIFVKINYYQRPVNKSLVYDLLGISKEIFPEYYMFHNVVKRLNEDFNSPFNRLIKMLGIGEGIISQASIISAIEKYKLQNTLEKIGLNKDDENILYKVLWVYFSFIKKKYINYWANRDYILCKSIGIRSLFLLLNDILINFNSNNLKFSMDNLDKIFNKIEIKFWESDDISKFGGEKGVKELYQLLKNKLKLN